MPHSFQRNVKTCSSVDVSSDSDYKTREFAYLCVVRNSKRCSVTPFQKGRMEKWNRQSRWFTVQHQTPLFQVCRLENFSRVSMPFWKRFCRQKALTQLHVQSLSPHLMNSGWDMRKGRSFCGEILTFLAQHAWADVYQKGIPHANNHAWNLIIGQEQTEANFFAIHTEYFTNLGMWVRSLVAEKSRLKKMRIIRKFFSFMKICVLGKWILHY